MPIWDHNGSSYSSIKYIWDHNGSTYSKINRVWDHNGSSYSDIWKSSITITNLLSAETSTGTAWSDYGYDTGTSYGSAWNTTSGHRYFARGALNGFAYDYGLGGFNFEANAQIGGHTITSWTASSEFTSRTWYANIIFTAGSSAQLTCWYKRYMHSQGSAYAYLYMLVDIAAFESAKGKTYGADEFYNTVGQFYGNKEISV